MVERKGPGYKCACKKTRVALMDDLLGKRYANFWAGNTCMKGQFLVFSKCNEVDVCRAVDTVGFDNRSVSLIKHNTCGRILGFKLVKVDPAMLDPQEKLLWVEGNFALLKDEILETEGYPLTDSDEEKEKEKEKEKKKMEEERLNEEKLRKKKEKKEKVKAQLILRRRGKGKERGVEKGDSLEASLEDFDKMLLLEVLEEVKKAVEARVIKKEKYDVDKLREKFTSLGTEKEQGMESSVEASFKAMEKALFEVFEEIQKAMEGGHKKEKEKEKDKREEEEREKKKEEEDH